MELDEYQEQAGKTAIFPDEIPDNVDGGVVYCALGMVGESGECAEKVKKAIREDDESYLDELESEIADVLWYVSQLCAELDLSLDDAALENLEKLHSRQQRDKLKGKGDNR
jgi:MazG nucleotide pyrophosphohydrolase domain.